jgi:hypothetical protein
VAIEARTSTSVESAYVYAMKGSFPDCQSQRSIGASQRLAGALTLAGLAALAVRCSGDDTVGSNITGAGGTPSSSSGSMGGSDRSGSAGATSSTSTGFGGSTAGAAIGGGAGQPIDGGKREDASRPGDADANASDADFVWDAPGPATITRIWLTHKTSTPTNLVVNWETPAPGDSTVMLQPPSGAASVFHQDESVTLHHVSIPLAGPGAYRYAVATGSAHSSVAVFNGYPADVLRVAVVGNWQAKPSLASIIADKVHLLMTAGDNVPGLHGLCGNDIKDCTKPYGALIDAYPDMFRSLPFMPVLGNHDKEIRDPSTATAANPAYDVDATAFVKFFELPDEEWHWSFGLPDFKVQFIALDIAHVEAIGTPLQACHPYASGTPQFNWYRSVVEGPLPHFVVTLYNEKNETVRNTSNGAWSALLSHTTIAATAYSYMAERAQAGSVTYYDTSLDASLGKLLDSMSQVSFSIANYLLLEFNRAAGTMSVDLKNLANGASLDHKVFP